MEAAKEHLAETSTMDTKIGDHLISLVSGDSYDAGRILLVEKVRDLGPAGRPVAMAPDRDVAYVTGEDDEVGLAMLTGLAAQAPEEQYALSGVPLVLDGDAWVDWRPPPGHPTYQACRNMELNFLVQSHE